MSLLFLRLRHSMPYMSLRKEQIFVIFVIAKKVSDLDNFMEARYGK